MYAIRSYYVHDKIIIHNPSPGFPNENKPNRNTQAIMLNSITSLIPKRFKKNGIAKINTVSDIWEIDMIIVEYLTTNESVYIGFRITSYNVCYTKLLR